eukprot:CAMPEP_0176365362 /NCGR_PEP_ID=MMETSP0126-20121128/20414_1 /TAXON_ID=141414 ORGANISM="Strombidinopsis acuminatum, Strain SPMC142" /NCGR_SAMPLE_ID=MMETSP0126 /ASSEMBLY_ACC=CAM_ASM_000229 /LENGTH=118 /DNA_ID=CAMNT_0017722327 /DNA_START=1869 /DNA_END=2225 /DNA_ORIENTATION=+
MGHYVDFKKQAEQQKEAALTKVTNFDQDIRKFSTTEGVDLTEFRRRNGSISLLKMRKRSFGSNSVHIGGGLKARDFGQESKETMERIVEDDEKSIDTKSNKSRKMNEPSSLQHKSNLG